MSSRKSAIDSLFLTKPQAPVASPSPTKATERVRTGAIAAMGSSLQEMTENAKSADRLRQQLANGETVIEIDPNSVEGSSISDRIILEIDLEFDSLVESIQANGQQVPILVRPHPEATNVFQIAYGRRRLRAAEKLGRPVKAIVRKLSDQEMIVAQGRENLDRQDLSFIEKALFAKRLEDAGYERETIIAALSTDKADLSRYIAVARRIPENLIHRIGPAPKSGRARWLRLAEKLTTSKVLETVERALADDAIGSMTSDTRFQAVWAIVEKQERHPVRKDSVWTTPSGKRGGQIEWRNKKTAIVFDETIVPQFAQFVSSRLSDLFDEYQESAKGDTQSD